MWLTASQDHPQDLPANHQDRKGKGTTMKTEEETEHREKDKKKDSSQGKKAAEKALTKDFVITVTI